MRWLVVRGRVDVGWDGMRWLDVGRKWVERGWGEENK